MKASDSAGWLSRYNKDYYGGGLMCMVGIGAIYRGLDYQVGTLTAMGPGYFPVAIGSVLALMGLIIVLGARGATPSATGPRHRPEWRGWSCILLANIAFVLLGHYGGLVPATFAVVFIAALGDRQNTWKSALVLALAMVAVCIIVFAWGLRLQFPLFRWG